MPGRPEAVIDIPMTPKERKAMEVLSSEVPDPLDLPFAVLGFATRSVVKFIEHHPPKNILHPRLHLPGKAG